MPDSLLPVARWEAAALVGLVAGCVPREGPSPETAEAERPVPVRTAAADAPAPPVATGALKGRPWEPDYEPAADTRAPCLDDTANILGGVVPAPFDYAELRLDQPRSAQAFMASGVVCGGARDRAACHRGLLAALDARLSETRTCGPEGCPPLLVYTRGDEAGTLLGSEALVSAVRPITSSDEAWLVLFFDRRERLDCEDRAERERPVVGGFELVTYFTAADCPLRVGERVVLVTEAGTVSVVSERLRPPSKKCAGPRPPGLATGPATTG